MRTACCRGAVLFACGVHAQTHSQTSRRRPPKGRSNSTVSAARLPLSFSPKHPERFGCLHKCASRDDHPSKPLGQLVLFAHAPCVSQPFPCCHTVSLSSQLSRARRINVVRTSPLRPRVGLEFSLHFRLLAVGDVLLARTSFEPRGTKATPLPFPHHTRRATYVCSFKPSPCRANYRLRIEG